MACFLNIYAECARDTFQLRLHLFVQFTKKIVCAPEIWDALRAATEADLSLAQAIVDSAGVVVQSADLTLCCDERGTT